MVSLGADSNFRDTIVTRSMDSAQNSHVHSDTAHLMQETDDVAFWDMSAGGNHVTSTVLLTTGEDEEMRKFHHIGSIPVISALLILMILDAIFVFVCPAICPDKCAGTVSLSWIIFVQIVFFVLVLVADFGLRRMHFKSRSWGYLEFYRRTRMYRKFPLAITAIFLAVFLFLVVLTEALCPDEHCGKNFSRANTLQIAVGLEVLLLIPMLVKYLHVCYRFNKARSTPDVLQEDLSTERILQTSVNQGNQVGFKEGNFKEDLLEKQADEILFLKRRNDYLSSRILHLTAQINAPIDQLRI